MEYTTSSNTICWDGRTGYKQLMLKSSSSKRYKDIGNDISEQEIENGTISNQRGRNIKKDI